MEEINQEGGDIADQLMIQASMALYEGVFKNVGKGLYSVGKATGKGLNYGYNSAKKNMESNKGISSIDDFVIQEEFKKGMFGSINPFESKNNLPDKLKLGFRLYYNEKNDIIKTEYVIIDDYGKEKKLDINLNNLIDPNISNISIPEEYLKQIDKLSFH